jgi:hypothetical protein
MLKAHCDKEHYLRTTCYSVECKQRNDYTYGWYSTKTAAMFDLDVLEYSGVSVVLLEGWDNEGFISLVI